MMNSKNFEAMSNLMDAIKQVDRILDQDESNMLESTLMSVKDIKLDSFEKSNKVAIINLIRSGLVKMYQDQMRAVNVSIGLDTSFSETDGSKCIIVDSMDPSDIMKDYTEGRAYASPDIK